jgi:DNA helicase-2/ATP-dependent DNA helicase PcrA
MRSVEQLAQERELSLHDAADRAVAEALVPPKQARNLRVFLDLLGDLHGRVETVPVAELLRGLLRDTDYQDFLDKSYPGQGADRMDNVRSLVSAAVEYEGESASPSLAGFLERSALVSDADEVGRGPGVGLMTIHCAKGLEFEAVFLAGLEENLFPHARSAASAEDVEEERRLCYVAMTRARQRLFLSRADTRMSQGLRVPNPPSRFLDEIPQDLIEEAFPGPGDLLAERSSRWSDGDVWKGSSAARAAARVRRDEQRGTSVPAALKDPGDGYPVGASVTHPRFGRGRIVDREGSGKTLKLTIRFTNHGEKKILPAYTDLQVQVAESETR